MNKHKLILKRIEDYQELKGYSDKETENSIIISIGHEYHKPIGLIKNINLDFGSGRITYTLTEDPKEALHFERMTSVMLYHYMDHFTTTPVKHSHYPVKK